MKELRISFPEPCGEKWEDMPVSGCNRHCASCDNIIYDLSQMAFDDVETLLTVKPDVCVRAAVDVNGSVRLKEKFGKKSGKMVVAMGASLGLMLAAEPAAASPAGSRGTISGKFEGYFADGWVTATDAQGKEYRTKVSRYGHYKFKKLPDGIYVLRFDTDCGLPWVSEPVVVQMGSKSKLPSVFPDDSDCIIIGSMKLDQNAG